jgi:hypothetical protein
MLGESVPFFCTHLPPSALQYLPHMVQERSRVTRNHRSAKRSTTNNTRALPLSEGVIPVTTATKDISRALNSLDRCDRCGAQAYIQAVLESTGGELLFCGHHGLALEPKLRPLSHIWNDYTSALKEKPIVTNYDA